MRKISTILGLAALVSSQYIKAQQEINFGNFSRPVSSVSSLATYTNIPVSMAAGTANISMPLFELPSKAKNISAPLSLAYNPMNVKQSEPASEAGTGWSLFAGGVISREVIGLLNESKYRPNASDYQEDEFNDIFYYNLPGVSGKFRFNRNIANNTIDIENLSANKIKISYIRDSNHGFFKINSFTITDEKGYKYIFNDYSESTDYNDGMYLYRSAFFLTQIKLPNDIPVISFSYRKDSKLENEQPTSSVVYRSCKLTKINSEGFGSVNIDYAYDATKENTMNDPYSITQILFKNTQGNIISGYKFNYMTLDLYDLSQGDSPERKGRRFLDKLVKLNKDLAEYEKTNFSYNPYQSLSSNPDPYNSNYLNYNLPGLLKKITGPTGGVTEYNYEPHDVFFNRSSPEYLEQMQTSQDIIDPVVQELGNYITVLNIDTNQSSTYNLSISGDPAKKKAVFLKLPIDEYYQPGIWVPDPTPDPNDQPSPDDPGGGPGGHYHFDITYTLKKNGVVIDPLDSPGSGHYYLYPGNYTIAISGTGGKAKLQQSEIKLKTPPYLNKRITYDYGPRIKSIKYYTSSAVLTPAKTEQYSYSQFTNTNSSSGYLFRNESEEDNIAPGYVLYKNVTATDGENGYTRHYYKTPDDYSQTPYTVNGNSSSFSHYYTIAKSGVPEKTEVYNAQNQMIASTDYEYTLETLNNLPDVKISGFNGIPTKYTKPAFIKNIKTVAKNYANNQYMENKSETAFSLSNFKTASVKETSSDGKITEKWIRYASDKNNTRLLNANILSLPLEIETKTNGKLIGKSETRYDDISNFYPTSVIASNPNDGSTKTTEKYDAFDSYGNLRQFTSDYDPVTGASVSTVIIWGYNQALPIARIDGAKLSDIGSLADDSIVKSNADTDASSEALLIKALDTFRANTALKNFQVTTYTYDPLIGATTITPPDGIREIYKYDQSNRLKAVVDVNGNIIKEYKYNTKTQP